MRAGISGRAVAAYCVENNRCPRCSVDLLRHWFELCRRTGALLRHRGTFVKQLRWRQQNDAAFVDQREPGLARLREVMAGETIARRLASATCAASADATPPRLSKTARMSKLIDQIAPTIA